MTIFNSLRQYVIVAERGLTTGERVMANSVFAAQLDYRQVRICASRLVLPHYALSPNGRVYFHPHDYCADFSMQDLATQSWLIHELVHVWQYQQGIRVLTGALLDRRYDYVLKTGKAFLAYGLEQQARMVQDYFLKRARGQACDDLAACIPFVVSL